MSYTLDSRKQREASSLNFDVRLRFVHDLLDPSKSDDPHRARNFTPPILQHQRQHQQILNNNAPSMTRGPSLLKRLRCTRCLHTVSKDPYNAFVSQHPLPPFPSSSESQTSPSPIHGKSIALKDNICTNDSLPTTCASRMLESILPNPNPFPTLSLKQSHWRA